MLQVFFPLENSTTIFIAFQLGDYSEYLEVFLFFIVVRRRILVQFVEKRRRWHDDTSCRLSSVDRVKMGIESLDSRTRSRIPSPVWFGRRWIWIKLDEQIWWLPFSSFYFSMCYFWSQSFDFLPILCLYLYLSMHLIVFLLTILGDTQFYLIFST